MPDPLFSFSFLRRFHRNYRLEVGSGCWFWLRGKDKDGYGLVKIEGKTRRAHRLMYEITFGPIPKGMLVMHSCDEPSCVCPSHLSVGTPKENTQDMIFKGRKHLTNGSTAQRGLLNGKAKLMEDDVREIRKRFKEGARQIDLAPEFGITQGAVHKIVSRKTWGHVGE